MSFTCEDPTAKVTFSEGLKMKKELAMSLSEEDTPTKSETARHILRQVCASYVMTKIWWFQCG